jgi:hypothetical protein
LGQIKPLLASLVSFYDNPDQSVRNEAQALTIELYRWLGPAIKPQIEKLRPAQVKEIEAAIEQLPKDRPVPQRYTKSQDPILLAAQSSTQAAEGMII